MCSVPVWDSVLLFWRICLLTSGLCAGLLTHPVAGGMCSLREEQQVCSHVSCAGEWRRKKGINANKKQNFMPLKSGFCYINHYYCIVIMINNHAISPEINYPKLSPYMYFYPDTYPTVYILLWLVLCYLFTQCWRFTTAIVGLLRNTVCL